MVDKRKYRRQDNMLVIEFWQADTPDQYYAGITHNYSDMGFCFESEMLDLVSGTSLEFRLKHPGREQSVRFSGDVVWTTKQNYALTAGVKVQSISGENRHLLHELISQTPSLPEETFIFSPVTEQESEVSDETRPEVCSDSTKAHHEPKTPVSENHAAETEYMEATVEPEPQTPLPFSEKDTIPSEGTGKPGIRSSIVIVLILILLSALFLFYLFNSKVITENHSSDRTAHIPSTAEELESSRSDHRDNDQKPDRLMDTHPADPSRNKYLNQDAMPQTDEYESTSPPPVSPHHVPASNREDHAAAERRTEPTEQKTDHIIMHTQNVEVNNAPVQSIGDAAPQSPYVIHVSAWKTAAYAREMNKKVTALYPNAKMTYENNYHIIMIPDIPLREAAERIAADLEARLEVTPLIFRQKRD